MNSDQIERIIRRHVRNFDGVFSSNTLPPRPNLLVANTKPNTEVGEHWVAIHVDDRGHGHYFDSFGRPPNTTFERYLRRHCEQWSYNNVQFQSVISSVCGQYCVCYCILQSRKVDLSCILGTDTALNDMLMREMANKLS